LRLLKTYFFLRLLPIKNNPGVPMHKPMKNGNDAILFPVLIGMIVVTFTAVDVFPVTLAQTLQPNAPSSFTCVPVAFVKLWNKFTGVVFPV
jgi:hypothetical protein